MGLITLSIVFLALSGIALIIYGVKFLVPLIEAGSRKPKAPVEGVPVVRKEVLPAASQEGQAPQGEVETEVVAAIAGAVAVLTGGMGKVVSVRPTGPVALRAASAWKLAGRTEGLEGL